MPSSSAIIFLRHKVDVTEKMARFREISADDSSMRSLKILSAAQQVAGHLREEIVLGTLTGFMPGGAVIARELGVGRTTADDALGILEDEGLVEGQGDRKRRLIVLPDAAPQHKPMQVGLILYEPEDAENQYVPELRQLLLASGFGLSLAPKTLIDLNHSPRRIETMMRKYPADAWVVVAGSRPLLKWLAESPFPAFALFGRMRGLPIRGMKPDTLPALRESIRTLAGLGHRRISLLAREERRTQPYGNFEVTFLKELKLHGINTGSYNIPDWKESAAGLRICLESLFRLTPPTAIYVGDYVLFLAVQNILRNNAFTASKKVALISTDYHPHMKWCDPPVPHFCWDHRATARKILTWLRQLQRGKPSLAQTLEPARFVEGNIRDFDYR
jgi:DNA-binding LacI/PurR family transcriptional regulator